MDKEIFAEKLRASIKTTGMELSPDNAVVLVPAGDITFVNRICGFRILYAHVPDITFAVYNSKLLRAVREFEDS